MAEWVYVGRQIVQPGDFVLFNETSVPCNLGLILYRAGSGGFLLKGKAVKQQALQRRCPCCGGNNTVNYKVKFGANVAVPEGETVGPITVAVVVGSATLLGTEMEVTPAAVEEFFNVSRDTVAPIFQGCCQEVGVRNTSTIPIAVENAIIGIEQ